MRLGIKAKCILLSLTVTIFSVLAITMYLYQEFLASYEEQITEQHGQLLTQLSYNLDAYMDEINRLAFIPYYSQEFLDQLKEEPQNLKEILNKQRNVESYIKAAMIYPREDISSVIMVSGELYVYGSYTETTNIEDTVQTDWYQKAVATKEPVILLKKNTFSVANAIWELNSQDSLVGVVRADASFATIQELCRGINLGMEGGIAILSEQDEVVYKTMSEDKLQLVMEWEKSGTAENGVDYRISQIELKNFGLRLVSYDSLDEFKAKLSETRNICVILVLIVSVLMTALLYRLMTLFFRPMYGMISLMQQIQQGDIALRYQRTGRRDEVEYMGTTFNSMLDRLEEMGENNNRLNRQIYSSQLLQRNLQLQLLYAQIRPHFIYNVLNSISIQVQCKKEEEAVKTINQFSLLLRGAAYINQKIALEMEVALAESYLALQKIRFGQRLKYSIEVSDETKIHHVPTLILQPIIENAIVHGCKEVYDEVFIRITEEYTDSALVIVVADDGDGMTEEELEKIRAKLSVDAYGDIGFVEDLSKASGLGLANVNERILICFGEPYGLEIESEYGKGTTVRVILPLELNA